MSRESGDAELCVRERGSETLPALSVKKTCSHETQFLAVALSQRDEGSSSQTLPPRQEDVSVRSSSLEKK